MHPTPTDPVRIGRINTDHIHLFVGPAPGGTGQLARDAGPALLIETEAFPDHVLLRLTGELDLVSAAEFSTALDTARRTVGKVVVDMGGVSFIDSTGLHSMARARRAGLAIVVRNPSTIVKRLLDVTHMTDAVAVEGHRPVPPEAA